MTDETTARDRAIEVVIEAWTKDSDAPYWGEDARLAVDGLLARPEVLCALAGAPTADVASPSKFREMAKVIDEVIAHYHQYNELDVPWLAETARRLRTMSAAPEGVDAADEHADERMRFVGWAVDRVDGSSSFGTFDRRESADEWCERLRGYGNDVHVVAAEVPDKPERFPRVAGRCPSCRGASLFLGAGGHVTCSRLGCPAPGVVDDQLHAVSQDEPDGMDLEAQGEMADQLAAAQAAIQRVRATASEFTARSEKCLADWEWEAAHDGQEMRGEGIAYADAAAKIVRALDGDTTEEKR